MSVHRTGERALVTGGGGFIGSHLVMRLLSEGFRVRVLDDWSTGKRENLQAVGRPDVTREAEVVEGDICDPRTVRRAVQGVRVVFHQAARASVPRSFEEPLEYERVNVAGTLTLLQACVGASVESFVFASSSACYGDLPDPLRREDLPPRPISPYAVSKLAGELYCRVFFERFGLETASLRYFNVFGPRQSARSQYAAVVPAFIGALLSAHRTSAHRTSVHRTEGRPPALGVRSTERPTVYGDGEQSRDFTFVEDVVEANLLAASAEGVGGEVFNVGCGRNYTVNALLRLLQEITGVRIDPVYAPPRPGDVRHTQADISKAKRLLNYRPKVSFEEGLRRTVDFFRSVH